MTNTLSLGRIGEKDLRMDKPVGDDEESYEESAKHVNYKSLKDSKDGSIFYDNDNHIIVIKIDGLWMKLHVESLPDSIKYDF